MKCPTCDKIFGTPSKRLAGFECFDCRSETIEIRTLIKRNISYDNLLKLFNEGTITFKVFNEVAKTCTIKLEFDKGDFDINSL